ncbi:MAG: spermidine/putrescine ABC transporter substrate-binding protein [Hyphomicrobiales bacterium]|nr:spermidine/putrescine ABC transporter substrate-binding protein [Hyphomicrobiales bacterium]
MSKDYEDDLPITASKFMDELRRYHKGSVSRRHFLGVTGLGTAMAVMSSAVPSLAPGRALAAGNLSNKMVLATWPNYHNPKTLENFTGATDVHIQANVFGSNEEMIAKMQAGGGGVNVIENTNYTFQDYVKLGLLTPLDLSRIPNYDPSTQNPKFAEASTVNGKVYGVCKNWGTTGLVINSSKVKNVPKSHKDFFDVTMGEGSGHTILHDYQLTTIGAALCALGYSFNSVNAGELAKAEKLLIDSKPHLFAITSDYQPGLRSGDAWMSICWSGDGKQLNTDLPEMKYVIASDGGELWSDFYSIPADTPSLDTSYAFINYMMDPKNQVLDAEAHGYPTSDSRVAALQPASVQSDPILHPAKELFDGLEFGAAVTLTDPIRAEVMARFKSA